MDFFSMAVNALLQELNPEQRAAAETKDGSFLVLAGAGSGKTKTLTYRIANLVANHGVQPQHMFVATFTNKAANEMKSRITKAIGDHHVDQLWVGTFHGLCLRILKRFCHLLGYEKSFSVYDRQDSEDLVRSVFRILNMPVDADKLKSHIQFISRCKNKGVSPQQADSLAVNEIQRTYALVYHYYERMKTESNSMDFDDLILNVISLLKHFDEPRSWTQDRFRYVMVDEYQDVNQAQYELISLIAYPHNNLFIIGDDYQSIYAFRGSDMQKILDFEKQFSGCQTFYLNRNYRSTKSIVAAGKNVIRKNRNQKEKQLYTHNEKGDPVIVAECENLQQEMNFITKMIKEKVHKERASYSDFAILMRSSRYFSEFEQHFLSRLVPYRMMSGKTAFESQEVKDLISYIRFILNPKDDVSLQRIINRPSRGIGKATIESIVDYAANHKISFYKALVQVDSIVSVKPAAKGKVKHFLSIYQDALRHLSLSPVDFVNYLLERTGYYSFLQELDEDTFQKRFANIRMFVKAIEEAHQNNPEEPIETFFQSLSLISDAENEDFDAVRIMTMHAAKGLEWPYVFLPVMNSGFFPSPMCKTERDMEEERRLAYVAFTRPEKELYITHSRWVQTGYGHRAIKSRPSPFVTDIEQEHVHHISLDKKTFL